MMMMSRTLLVLACCTVTFTAAFSPVAVLPSQKIRRTSFTRVFSTPEDQLKPTEELKQKAEEYEAPRMNPDRPELPELKGDFDWDAKFGGDDDWITENVPGKVVLSEMELAAQVTALTKLEEQWRKERIQKEYEAAQILGFSVKAETFNGRLAMFFLTVGLLTELWTGVTLPGQVEEMLRVGGFIGFEE